MWHNHIELVRAADHAERLNEARRERWLREAKIDGRSAGAWSFLFHLPQRLHSLTSRARKRLDGLRHASPPLHPAETVVLRLVILSGEVCRLPDGDGVRVRSGRAWITYAGKDIVLRRGEQIVLAAGDDFALVSALGSTPLVLEVLCDRPHPHGQTLIGAPALSPG